MNDVIDIIALVAKQNPRDNVVEHYCCPNGYNLLKPEEIKNRLSPERIGELNQEIILRQHLPAPRLTIEEIDAILSDYPYKLPVEFYNLYQRGNGVLPIGLGDKDWNCYYNYFYFPDPEMSLLSLGEAMKIYGYLFKYLNEGWSKVEPNIFPLISTEVGIWAIGGSNIQQPTSAVFHFHADDISSENFQMKIVWNNLTEMISDRCSDGNLD
ncbi:hypothetical protein [Chamaesiphon sp.]|uniref:hypothetical protein n=1 Tax=Chamaesiphon sp. TaxID=2814140 RepID=UPI0035937E16